MSADITKCRGDQCPLKESCYRFLAHESPWQSYFVDVPGLMEKNDDGENHFTCEYYWQYGEKQ